MGFSPRPAALPVPDPGERCSLTCQHYPQSAHSASCLSPLALPPLPIGPRSSPALSSQPSVPASSLGSWPPLFQPPVHPPECSLGSQTTQDSLVSSLRLARLHPAAASMLTSSSVLQAPRDHEHVSGYPLWPFQTWHTLPIQPGTPVPSLLSSLCSYLSSRSLFRGPSSRDPRSQADASTASGIPWFPTLPPSQPSPPPAPIQATTT